MTDDRAMLEALQDAIEASPDRRTWEQWTTLFEAAHASQKRQSVVVFDGYLWNEYMAAMTRQALTPQTLDWYAAAALAPPPT